MGTVRTRWCVLAVQGGPSFSGGYQIDLSQVCLGSFLFQGYQGFSCARAEPTR